MKKIEILKTVGGIIVSVGVATIVGNAIKCTTPPSMGTIKKVCIAVGTLVLTSMAGDRAVEYTEHKIDSAVVYVKSMIEEEGLKWNRNLEVFYSIL